VTGDALDESETFWPCRLVMLFKDDSYWLGARHPQCYGMADSIFGAKLGAITNKKGTIGLFLHIPLWPL
jgi:hypothetical protein